MKQFGSWTEVVGLVFRSDAQAITFRPHQATAYTAARDIQLPPGDANHILVSEDATQTLTNKTISGASNTVTNVSLTTGVTGTLPTANGGTGQNSTATFPTSGVVVTEAGTQTLTNKTIDGDTNTVQDLALASLKTVLADASKFLVRDASGIVVSNTKAVPAGVVVGDTDTQTLTNKTLTTPVISSPTVSGTLLLQNAAGAQPELQLSEDPDNGTNKVTIKAPATLAADYALTLPVDDGTANQALTTDGAGVLSWTTVATASTATPTAQGLVTSYFPTIQSATLTSSSATINVTTTDGYQEVLCSGTSGTQTVNLPAAASNPGRRLTIIKTASGGSVVVDANASELISGTTTKRISSQYGKMEIVCDGSNWFLTSDITEPRLSFTPTWTNATATSSVATYCRLGENMLIQVHTLWGSGFNAADLEFTIPNSLTLNTSYNQVGVGATGQVGDGTWYDGAGTYQSLQVVTVSGGTKLAFARNGTTSLLQGNNMGNSHRTNFSVIIPITEWA